MNFEVLGIVGPERDIPCWIKACSGAQRKRDELGETACLSSLNLPEIKPARRTWPACLHVSIISVEVLGFHTVRGGGITVVPLRATKFYAR